MAVYDRRNVVLEIGNQTVKDPPFRSGTRHDPTLVINLTKIGSTLSLEERRLHAWGRSAFAEFTAYEI
jgi:hypothetical protein